MASDSPYFAFKDVDQNVDLLRVNYKANFEERIVARIEVVTGILRQGAVVTAASAEGLRTFLPKDREDQSPAEQFMYDYGPLCVQAACGALVAGSRMITVLAFHSRINAEIMKQINMFMDEIEGTLEVIKERLGLNFERREAADVVQDLFPAESFERSSTSFTDELKMMTYLNAIASNLRHSTFTLRNAMAFYKVKNVFVIQDPLIDMIISLRRELKDPSSPKLAKAFKDIFASKEFADSKPKAGAPHRLREMLADFAEFVASGKSATPVLSEWQDKMLHKVRGVRINPTSIWLYRIIVSFAHEFHQSGTTILARVFAAVCSEHSFFEVDVNSKGLHQPGEIHQENLLVEFEPSLTLRKGWRDTWTSDNCLVQDSKHGTLILRFLFTVELGTRFQSFGVGEENVNVLGLLKSTKSNLLQDITDLSANPVFFQFFSGSSFINESALDAAEQLVLG